VQTNTLTLLSTHEQASEDGNKQQTVTDASTINQVDPKVEQAKRAAQEGLKRQQDQLRRFMQTLNNNQDQESTRIRGSVFSQASDRSPILQVRDKADQNSYQIVNEVKGENTNKRVKIYGSVLFRLAFGHQIKQYKAGKISSLTDLASKNVQKYKHFANSIWNA